MSQQFAPTLSFALAAVFAFLALLGSLDSSRFWLFYGIFALLFLLDGIRRVARK